MSTLGKLEKDFEEGIKDFSEWIVGKTESEIDFELRRRVKDFWDKQPWYLQLLRPIIMRNAYKTWRKLIK